MRILPRISLLRIFLAAACCAVPAAALAAGQPHDLTQVQDPTLCAKCHQGNPTSGIRTRSRARLGNPTSKPSNPGSDGVAICTQCHEADVSHMVGVEVDFPVPEDLPLSEDNTVTCLTCHKPHGPLVSDRPWSNVSFIDRLLNTEAMRKTYLLRRNNEHGELCLVCHAAEPN